MAGDTAQTMAFATVALAELAFVFSCRSAAEASWHLPRNGYLLGAVGASAGEGAQPMEGRKEAEAGQ
jgi:hypothetical protein